LVYTLNKNILKKIFYKIFLIRSVEERIIKEYPKQDIRCPVHLSIGQEAVPSILSLFVNKKDLAVSSHRGHAHYIAKGGSIKKMIAEIYGKKTGCSKGKGGSMHLIDTDAGFYGTSAIVGNSIPVGLGLAYDFRIKKNKSIGIVYLGDGALEEGVFYETMNLAATKKIQTLFICENNLYSVYSPLSVRQPNNRNIVKMVKEMGVEAVMCDGNNIKKVFNVFKNTLNSIRKLQGRHLFPNTIVIWFNKRHLGYLHRMQLAPYFDLKIGSGCCVRCVDISDRNGLAQRRTVRSASCAAHWVGKVRSRKNSISMSSRRSFKNRQPNSLGWNSFLYLLQNRMSTRKIHLRPSSLAYCPS
jgi:pyruvate dehydrogenase E1 component alpha subunit